ncbi:hypothetical protein ACA910_015380 [Epithemia clementina (nom. ined.)]
MHSTSSSSLGNTFSSVIGSHAPPPAPTPYSRYSHDLIMDQQQQGEFAAWMEPNPIDYNGEPINSYGAQQQQQQQQQQSHQDLMRNLWAPWHPSYGDPTYFPSSWLPPSPTHPHHQPPPSSSSTSSSIYGYGGGGPPPMTFYHPPSFHQQPTMLCLPSVSTDQDQDLVATPSTDTMNTHNTANTASTTNTMQQRRSDSPHEHILSSSGPGGLGGVDSSTFSATGGHFHPIWHSPIQQDGSSHGLEERGGGMPEESMHRRSASSNLVDIFGRGGGASSSRPSSRTGYQHERGPHPMYGGSYASSNQGGGGGERSQAALSSSSSSTANRIMASPVPGLMYSSSSSSGHPHPPPPLLFNPHGGIPLAIPSDDEHLSEYHCLVRAQIDLFAAGEADFQSNMQGRNRPIVRDQVGLRCRHCAGISPPNRRPPGAVYYPSKLSGLYQAAVNMAKNHFMVSCQRIPLDIKARLARLKEKKTYMLGGGKGYWSTGGRIRNVIEVDNRLFFESQGGGPPPGALEAAEAKQKND